MSDEERALGFIKVAMDNLGAVETSGSKDADEEIMKAEQALRRARILLKDATRNRSN